jgi:predicted RND superfamily exporter protein
MLSMKSIAIIVIALLFLLSLYIVIKRWKTVEGFLEVPNVDNVLLNLMPKLKRMTKYLINPTVLSERIAFASMSPVELARHYIKTQTNSRENGKA